MSFAENLRRIRKEKHLSREELAEMLDVSRQAVSKWEQGTGYPEVDKLLILSRELNVSLDSLMAGETRREKGTEPDKATGMITISSPYEHVVASCCKVMPSPKFKGGKKSPQYALFAAGNDAATFRGKPTYELKYSAKVEKKLFSVKITDISKI